MAIYALNSVNLQGRITQNPELKTTQVGKKVLSFALAVPKSKDEADFVECVAWEKTAEIISSYCKKGSMIIIDGHISTRIYETNGNKRKAVEIIVDNVYFTEKKQSEGPVEEDLPF